MCVRAYIWREREMVFDIWYLYGIWYCIQRYPSEVERNIIKVGDCSRADLPRYRQISQIAVVVLVWKGLFQRGTRLARSS